MTNVISKTVSTIKHWWLFLILGLLLLVGGIWIAFTPAAGFIALVALFIGLLLVSGIFFIIFSISNQKELSGWGWYLAGGILEFLIGIFLWSRPDIAMGVLTVVVGLWILFRGISIIAISTDLKGMDVKGWGWLMTLGILMTILSFMMILDIKFGAKTVVFFTAIALIFMGIAYTILSFKLKKIKSKLQGFVKEAKGDMDKLKKAVMDSLQDANPQVKEKVSKMFDDYSN